MEKNTVSIRMNFTNGQTMRFDFDAFTSATQAANEINAFLQKKVAVLKLKDSDGKRYFKASSVLPNRKHTLDVLVNGLTVQSSLMGIELLPGAIFKKEGEFFSRLLTVLLCETGNISSAANLADASFRFSAASSN